MPTGNTAAPSAWLSMTDGFDIQYVADYLRFTLPDIGAGSTLTLAKLHLDCDSFGFAYDLKPFVGPSPSWTNSTTDLSGVALDADPSGATVTIASGWNEWDLLGDASKGLTKIFADGNGNPGDVTVMVGFDAAPLSSVWAGLKIKSAALVESTFVATGAGGAYIELAWTLAASAPGPPGASAGLIFC